MVDADVELGRYGDARRTLERMLNARPDLSSYSRASYFLELHGDIAGARRALQQAIASGAPARENTAWAYLYLGNLEFGQGHYAAAQRQYRLARPGAAGVRPRDRRGGQAGCRPRALRRGDPLYMTATQRLPLPAYVIALGDVQAAAGRRAAAARTYGLVRAEEALYQANGVNVESSWRCLRPTTAAIPSRRSAMRRRRPRCSTASWSRMPWAGRCIGPAIRTGAGRGQPRAGAGHARRRLPVPPRCDRGRPGNAGGGCP